MFKYLAAVVLSSILLVTPGNSQAVNAGELQKIAAERETMNSNLSGDPHQRLEQEQARRLFVERQIQLRLDTEKLLALAAELKLHVDKTGANVPSMDVIKKAREIQKLAKSVQDKMRNGY